MDVNLKENRGRQEGKAVCQNSWFLSGSLGRWMMFTYVYVSKPSHMWRTHIHTLMCWEEEKGFDWLEIRKHRGCLLLMCLHPRQDGSHMCGQDKRSKMMGMAGFLISAINDL